MGVSVEWIAGVLRAGREHEKHGDPYTFSCTVIVRGTHAELVGASGEFTPEIYREIFDRLVSLGMESASWDRKKKSKTLNRRKEK